MVDPLDKAGEQRRLVSPIDDDRTAGAGLLERIRKGGALPRLLKAAAQLEPVPHGTSRVASGVWMSTRSAHAERRHDKGEATYHRAATRPKFP
jgi:hypothetical protein